jgi:hypothetical protein
MYQYWAFGLNILSEIEFPEMLPHSFSQADIDIRLGEVPPQLAGEDVKHKVRMSASPTEYLIHVLKIGRYYAANGKNIVIEPEEGADMESLRLFTLSNAMAAILHQQGKIPLHASAIIVQDALVLFTGRSGAGKSTTACALMKEGYRLFSDDVCVLSLNKSSGAMEVFPSYPMMKLWENTIDELDTSMKKQYRVRPHLPKYGFFQHHGFMTGSLPVKQVFVLNVTATQNELSCKPLDKFKAFQLLQLNTYRRVQVGMMQLHRTHFEIISKLTSEADVFEVTRPLGWSDIPAFARFIKDQINGYAKA